MASVSCRCGEKLKLPSKDVTNVKCIRCGELIRVRSSLPEPAPFESDGFLRFNCSCGRRLKVPAESPPTAGRCPDCGRIVPVPSVKHSKPNPSLAKADSETRTEDLDASDLSELKKWSESHFSSSRRSQDSEKRNGALTGAAEDANEHEMGLSRGETPVGSVVKFETGLRICPQCKKPLHLGAYSCRECGTLVPRQ